MAMGPLSDAAKSRLLRIQELLNQNVIDLIQDAALIREAVESLQGQLPQEVEEALFPAAYIEVHRPRVLKAKQQLENR
jgi:hypothetical protein